MISKWWHGWSFGGVVVFTLAGCSILETSPTLSTAETEASDSPARLSLARLSERHGDIGQASQLYQAILQRDPQNQAAHHRLAVIAAQQQKLDLAREHFEQALESGAPYAELLSDRAYAYYLRHDLEQAEQSARQALELDPQHEAARNNLALILGEKGDYDTSLAEFRKVVGEAEAHANLAYVKAMTGDLPAAEESYHQALAKDSSLRPAAQALLEIHDHRTGTVRDRAPQITMMASSPRSQTTPTTSTSLTTAAGGRQAANLSESATVSMSLSDRSMNTNPQRPSGAVGNGLARSDSRSPSPSNTDQPTSGVARPPSQSADSAQATGVFNVTDQGQGTNPWQQPTWDVSR